MPMIIAISKMNSPFSFTVFSSFLEYCYAKLNDPSRICIISRIVPMTANPMLTFRDVFNFPETPSFRSIFCEDLWKRKLQKIRAMERQ